MKASLFSFHLKVRNKLRFGFAVIRACEDLTGECGFHCGVASAGNENTKMWSDFQREETKKLSFRELALCQSELLAQTTARRRMKKGTNISLCGVLKDYERLLEKDNERCLNSTSFSFLL